MHSLVSYSLIFVATVGWWGARNILEWRHKFCLLIPVALFFCAFPINARYDRYLVAKAAKEKLAAQSLDKEIKAACASWANPEWVAAHRYNDLTHSAARALYYLARAFAPNHNDVRVIDGGIIDITRESQIDDIQRFLLTQGLQGDPDDVRGAREYLKSHPFQGQE